MDVGIIGAGSIGLLLGSHIAASGLAVTMLVRQKSQQDTLNRKGIYRLDEDGVEVVTPVQATMDYKQLAQSKVVIIAVKYKDVAVVLTSLKEHDINVPLVFIQNGIGHVKAVSEADFSNVAFATVEHGALKQDEYRVKHNGIGNITIGLAFGEMERFDCLEQAVQGKFPIHWHGNAPYILLRKTLINCLINPLTTILNVSNGTLLTNPNSYQLMKSLYDELIDVFPEMQMDLAFDAIENICERTAENTSSMLSDYRNGRPMEIETIVTAVIQLAEERGGSLPLLQTYEQCLLVLDRKAITE